MKASEVLRKARALIDRPEKWTQGSMDLWLPTQSCAGRAIIVAANDDPTERRKLGEIFEQANNIRNIPYWNDAPERTHAEVMQAFDRAIALAEQEEQINAPLSESAHLSRTRKWLEKIQADVHLVSDAVERQRN